MSPEICKAACFRELTVEIVVLNQIRYLLVSRIARPCFACLMTFHKLFLDAGSSPVLGSSM